MKAKQMLVITVLAAASALIFGGQSFARGGAAVAGSGQGVQTGIQLQTRSMNQSLNQVRPEGWQRRDGSFLSTGTTANGSTTRPSRGRGLMDGTGINHPASPAP